MKAAIDAVPYASVVKTGLQFRRRFWEEDEHIFGGISYTDLPIRQISYPSTGYNAGGKGVLLGGYTWDGAERLRTHRDVAGRAHQGRARLRRADPSAISRRVRDRRIRRLASRAVHPGLRGRMDRRGAPRPLRRSLPDRRPHRAGGRARLLHSRPGRRARSCPRSTRSRACTSACSRIEGAIDAQMPAILLVAALSRRRGRRRRRRPPPPRGSPR